MLAVSEKTVQKVPFKQISKCDANNPKIVEHLKLQIKE